MAQKPTTKPASAVSTKHPWTAENLKSLATDRVQDLRARSIRLDAPDLTLLCDAELAARSERQALAKSEAAVRNRRNGVVTEYHFVCSGNRGVFKEPDGTFRTGSWVVAEDLVTASLKYGALVALHEAKVTPSYRQGTILGYEVTPRDMINKDNLGIEFHVRPTSNSLPWVGEGAGEKGYRWSDA